MIKKIASYILIASGLFLLGISTSTKCMEYISEKRNESEAWWGTHQSTDGDLVGMSYLDYIEQFRSKRDYAFTRPNYNGPTNVNFYAWGDSYIWKVPDTAYAGIKNYKFGWRYRDNIEYSLDTAQKNILLIEIAERYIRSYFVDTDMYNHVYAKKAEQTAALTPFPPKRYAAVTIPDVSDLFNPLINQNLEYNLFNYNFINPTRQYKASLNYYLFNRASGDVVIAENKQQLFLKETVLGDRPENIYHPVSNEEIRNIIGILNIFYDHYRRDGFDEVYLSLIPNPATIIQPEGYNDLIPRLQNDTSLKMPIIDIYSIYHREQRKRKLYRPGDTHWYNEGLQVWLSEVNKMLISNNQ